MHWADELHLLLLRLSGLINRPDIDERLLADAGIELERALFPLLSRIGVFGPISVVELAAQAGRDHSTVSRQVERLEELGLVERRPSLSDRRVRLLAPTSKGHEILKRLAKVRRKKIKARLADFTDTERDQLIELLRRFSADEQGPRQPE
ncbi:MarR family winged helix-turn-helix transcriptional regulator [Candidatus Viadribacter manganicus]|uniref:HTH marR-type domain-containing protein n=1 Tax=Candidatus Viadribacter manganicus TaxID=1759059 RepID=A0A1B1AGK6_9PROT|nr:MarR family transcriptional regulator [Candidatus Viadribacter manganicus]ANP45687.1 hypothetical protein ATE48_07005 [Candidatus Viadribacter manganicus]